MHGVVSAQLEQLAPTLKQQNLFLEVTPEGQELLARSAWDPTFGARPLRRLLQRRVLRPLATMLLRRDEELPTGARDAAPRRRKVTLDAQDGEFVLSLESADNAT